MAREPITVSSWDLACETPALSRALGAARLASTLCARQKGNYSPASPEVRQMYSLVVMVLIARPLATAALGYLGGH
jgi:hypothetical protein